MMQTIDDFAVEGLRMLVRADLNVRLDGGRVADDGRTAASSARNSAIWPLCLRQRHGPGSDRRGLLGRGRVPHRPDRAAVQGWQVISQSLSRRAKARLATAAVPMTANSATATADGMVVVPFAGLAKIMSPP